MSRLTFKQVYIEPILRGEKTSTIRARCRVQPGQRVQAICQYHRPPFAELEIEAVEELPAAEVPAEARAIYPGLETLWRIRFRTV